MFTSCDLDGGTENAGLEKSGLENVGPNRSGGKDGTGKRGNIRNVRGHVRVNVTAGRRDPRTLQEATQSGN